MYLKLQSVEWFWQNGVVFVLQDTIGEYRKEHLSAPGKLSYSLIVLCFGKSSVIVEGSSLQINSDECWAEGIFGIECIIAVSQWLLGSERAWYALLGGIEFYAHEKKRGLQQNGK